MSHQSMGPIPCQEAYLGLEGQEHYSSLDILLAPEINFLGEKRYCPAWYWFHSASAQETASCHTTSSSTSCSVGLGLFFL